jgi:eukaryotic-like serine/threonine-protein kinase
LAEDTPTGKGSGESPPAGWYPDPTDAQVARYWDGRGWTDFTGPLESPSSHPAAAPALERPRRLGSLAWAAYSVLALTLLANLADMVISLDYGSTLETQIDDRSLTLDEAYDAEDTYAIAGGGYALSMLAAAIGFLIWFNRAYKNAKGLTRRPLRYGTGWSVGAWFIPIFNFWRPKQIANDVWRAGDSRARDNERWNDLEVSSLVHWWWVFYLLAGFIGGIAGGLLSIDPVLSDSVLAAQGEPTVGSEPSSDDLEQERAAAIVNAASSAFFLVAGVLAILFVKQASERQDERIAETDAEQPAT